MKYKNWQKILSSITLFFLFFSITFRLPFFSIFSSSVFAEKTDFYNLVSIIVNEDIYDQVKNKVERYANDIQWALENTRAVILPVPSNASAFELASINEGLYFDWFKSLEDVSFQSKLIWTVFVWDITLPIVFEWENFQKTVVPFVDFYDKSYVYNHETKRYEKNIWSINEFVPEIWHWFISPNFWSDADNIDAINDYFDKNHDFYIWEWNFDSDNWVINWLWELPSNYEPFVFYYDQFREESAMSYQNYKWYEAYKDNLEDISYNRFTKKLAEKVKDMVLWEEDLETKLLLDQIAPGLDISWVNSWPDISKSSDIQTMILTEKTIKKFVEVFNSSSFWEFKKNVFNSWRYNWIWSEVNADFAPSFISILDEISAKVLKDATTDLEDEIDLLVKNWLSRKIPILTKVNIASQEPKLGCLVEDNTSDDPICLEWIRYDRLTYDKFYNWKKASFWTFKSANECSIYRWSTSNSWTLVEANRWLNTENIQVDIDMLQEENEKRRNSWYFSPSEAEICLTSSEIYTNWWFWGSSPANLDMTLANQGQLGLDNYNLQKSVFPLYDIKWSKEVFDNSKIPSPLNCFDNNLIKTNEKSIWEYIDSFSDDANVDYFTKSDYLAPVSWNISWYKPITTNEYCDYWNCITKNTWSCRTDNTVINFDSLSFENVYWSSRPHLSCSNTSNFYNCSFYWENNNSWVWKTYNSSDRTDVNYKFIPSYVEHKSPSIEELNKQLDNMMTPSLPVDRDRYIDFIWVKWDYIKINYPYLFRLNLPQWVELNFDNIDAELKKVLQDKSNEINNIIANSDLNSMSAKDREIYNLLKTADLPNASIDLYNFLKSKPWTQISSFLDSKDISYYDTLVFAIYWNNLNSTWAKYRFIFENYLSDEFLDLDNDFHLPRNKKAYEIAYIWAPWDARNMFVKVDPEWKSDNPYADIISSNYELDNILLWTNISSNSWDSISNNNSWVFECAPPEWVPIFEWIPAITCWLKNMLPPKISLSQWSCWGGFKEFTWFEDWTLDEADLLSCTDTNKNWIYDCLEQRLEDASIELRTDSSKYFYNSAWKIFSQIVDKDGNIISFDNVTQIWFILDKVEIAENTAEDISDINKVEIYNSNTHDENSYLEAKKYINFSNTRIRANRWEAWYWFTVKWKDANVYFKTFIEVKDNSWEVVYDIESESEKIEIRWERLFLSSSLYWEELDLNQTSVLADLNTNVFLIDWYKASVEDSLDQIREFSNSWEKLIFDLSNFSRKSNTIPVSYPLNIKLFKWDENINEREVSEWEIQNFLDLYWITDSWIYSLVIVDGLWQKIEKSFEILPWKPSKLDINLWSNVLEKWWNVTTNLISVLDKYDNPVSWELYVFDMKVNGDGLLFSETNESSWQFQTFQWFRSFWLKSTESSWNNSIEINLKDIEGNDIISDNIAVRVFDQINLDFDYDNNIKVWWSEYNIWVSLIDESWNKINNFDSRIYFIADNSYIQLKSPYSDVLWWESDIVFNTKSLASESLPVEFKIEWINRIFNSSMVIFPDKPMKIDLSLSKTKMEASMDEYSLLKAELIDRYWNLVFNDNSTTFDLEIEDKYKWIINSNRYSKKSVSGSSQFTIDWTSTPWIWYLKVSVEPWLESNSFVISWGDSDLVVNWISENAARIETFFFWDKEDVDNKNYNSIYTTLLWSNYWDIKEQDYLAWSIIFNNKWRSLVSTTLLNNPYKVNDVLSIKSEWNIKKLYDSNDLTQDIGLNVSYNSEGKPFIGANNNWLNTYLWNIYYNIEWAELLECNTELSECFDNENTSIVLKSLEDGYSLSWIDDKLLIGDLSWTSRIEINSDFSINRFWNLYLELDEENTNDYLVFNILNQSNIIWKIWLNIIWGWVIIVRNKTILETQMNNFKNNIFVYLPSNTYLSRNPLPDTWDKNIYYNDPFATSYTLDSFSEWNFSSYENFVKQGWLWWEWWNKTLLSFTSWKSVWESVKDYQSFSVINIWDPVVSLPKIKKTFSDLTEKKFDSTIWSLVVSDKDVLTYHVFDYDANDLNDILLVKDDGYLKILESSNKVDDFDDIWNVAYVVDMWNYELLWVWDFTWDKYDDIFFVDKDWYPNILNNNQKDFLRINLKNIFWLDYRIVASEVFDMDNDGKSDIVTLDENGDINIFYWWWSPNNPIFTKLEVDSWNGVYLNSDIRNVGTSLYYDWLYQIPVWSWAYSIPDSFNSSVDWIWWWSDGIDDSFINRMIFEQISYNMLVEDEVINNIDQIDTSIDTSSPNKILTFIKWQYSSSSDINLEKKYIDLNGGTLKTWDIVDVEINLRNTTNSTVRDIKLLDSIPNIFKFDINSLQIEDWEWWIRQWLSSYDLLIEDMDLSPFSDIKITYKLETLPLRYWYLNVWYFEENEAWDDEYWDIMLKENKENCSKAELVYRSSDVRSYIKWEKLPTCDESKLQLPDELKDEDWNWVLDSIDVANTAADYLQNLNINSSNNFDASSSSELLTFQNNWNEILSEFMPAKSDWWSLLDDLANINANIDSYLEWIDNLVDWFWCWFGWWSCWASPMNWAPLAPWSDPMLFGFPIWDWLKIWEWMPIFSAMTWIPVYWPHWCFPIPTVWPASPIGLSTTCSSNSLWAGWYLWITDPANFFRLFVTPTLTWWVWMAACFGWPAIVSWYSSPPWVHPIVPWWNCIVAAKPLASCSADWSDWDVRSLWTVSYLSWWWASAQFWVINWTCNSNTQISNQDSTLDPNFVDSYVSDKSSWNNVDWLKDSYSDMLLSSWRWHSVWYDLPSGPLISWFWWWWGDEFGVWVDFAALEDWNFKDVIKIKQSRISAFPDFLMDWVTRQIEEVVTKLTDFPTLFIILPDFSKVMDAWFDSFPDEYMDISNSSWKKVSWFKNAYMALASLPFINIHVEKLYVTLPSIDETTQAKFLNMWNQTLLQWKNEVSDKTDSWSLWATCDDNDTQCKEDNAHKLKIIADANWLIWSLEKNIEVLNSYKEFPKKLNKLISIKEVWLEQLLCNVEAIWEMTTGWITKNGKRFKAWVELFVLIKAILKSWQLLIDVFVDYWAECHECKNERWNLQTFIWKMISFVIPKIPVIPFPKWPDIVLDLHNIRLWVDVYLPEFDVQYKPLILPDLPNLYLPEFPDVNVAVDIPELPILPELDLPELPELPSLPKVELPDLPPPPTMPKLLAPLEWILEILKLITKIMCIIKTSPFVPEWRAWDQIAFLTDRTWFLKLDFLDLSLPQFSFSFVDAIEVKSYVNFELEADFIVELARQALAPVNTFSNNINVVLKNAVPDLDLRDSIPSSIDIEVWADNLESYNIEDQKDKITLLSFTLASWVNKLLNHIENNKDIRVSNREFISLVNQSLSSESVTSDPRLDELRQLWADVSNMTYSKEEKIINELEENNREKFEELRSIILEEISENRKLKKKIKNKPNENLFKTVSLDMTKKVDNYNSRLKKYNEKSLVNLSNLVTGVNYEREELTNDWEKLISRVETWIDKYKNDIGLWDNQLALNNVSNTSSVSWNACTQANSWDYNYKYEWIYIVEWDRSYRLFDYTDELKWWEEFDAFDFDSDWDDDLIYRMWQEVFIKENLSSKPVKSFVNFPPLKVDSSDNKYVNWDVFYNSVNNAKEVNVSSSAINLWFSDINWASIDNYRIEYYNIIDKRINENDVWYIPEKVRKSIIDSFSNIDDNTIISEDDTYSLNNNLGYFRNIWVIPDWVILNTKEIYNIRDSLSNNQTVNLSPGTPLYASDTWFTIDYLIWWSEYSKFVWAYKNISFSSAVEIIAISGNAYIAWAEKIITWSDINSYIWKPIFVWTYLTIQDNNNYNESNHIEIVYYDNTRVNLDFRDIEYYSVYDLWAKNSDYLVRINLLNDYYYAIIKWFKNSIFSNGSNPILLSPQAASDTDAPELLISSSIRVPVYLEKNIDFTEYIYDPAWLKNIEDFYIDFDLTVDSDSDWNKENDNDTDKIIINKNLVSINATFWPYDSLFTKDIWITIVDKNWNVWYRKVPFEVYAPIPQIESYSWSIVDWYLNETLTREPVNLYRYRWWMISKLSDVSWSWKVMTSSWLYDFEVDNNLKWLELRYNWNIIARINENTWKIIFDDPLILKKVLPSNSTLNTWIYPELILSKWLEEIYRQQIQMSWQFNFAVVSSFWEIEDNWVYLMFTDKSNYNYFQIPENAPYNPWVVAIHRNSSTDKLPLFSIYPDGRIDSINLDNFTLEYDSFNDYVVLRLIDKTFNREIAKVMYGMEGSYIIK